MKINLLKLITIHILKKTIQIHIMKIMVLLIMEPQQIIVVLLVVLLEVIQAVVLLVVIAVAQVVKVVNQTKYESIKSQQCWLLFWLKFAFNIQNKVYLYKKNMEVSLCLLKKIN